MRIRFITSTPLNVEQGSGTSAGIVALVSGLRQLGVSVELITPELHLPIYTVERVLFNNMLRFRTLPPCDFEIGFDMDGYTIAGRDSTLHIASIKGVIADEMRFEKGLTHATMAVQARCEALHVRRATAVMTTSRYSAERLRTLYGIPLVHSIVPELLDLAAWRALLRDSPGRPDPTAFTVLAVGRFYPRKRLHLLLEAASLLRKRISNLKVRIVGGGPEAGKLQAIRRQQRLEHIVDFLFNVPAKTLAAEYNRCDVFCLPSVQEGFGIVFLEAMAAGKPIVAARAAAVPEVVQQGIIVEPESAVAIAEGLEKLHLDSKSRKSIAQEGLVAVEGFDVPVVAKLFLQELEKIKTK